MLPLHIGCLFGFPIGLWSLATLLRNDVRAAFGTRRQPSKANGKRDYPSDTDFYGAPPTAGRSGIGRTIVFIILMLLAGLLLVAALGIGGYWAMPM